MYYRWCIHANCTFTKTRVYKCVASKLLQLWSNQSNSMTFVITTSSKVKKPLWSFFRELLWFDCEFNCGAMNTGWQKFAPLYHDMNMLEIIHSRQYSNDNGSMLFQTDAVLLQLVLVVCCLIHPIVHDWKPLLCCAQQQHVFVHSPNLFLDMLLCISCCVANDGPWEFTICFWQNCCNQWNLTKVMITLHDTQQRNPKHYMVEEDDTDPGKMVAWYPPYSGVFLCMCV